MSTDPLLERPAPDEVDDDAYFADLAAGAALPASALPDPAERPGTAGRSVPPATGPAARKTPRPHRRKLRRGNQFGSAHGQLTRARQLLRDRRALAAAERAQQRAERRDPPHRAPAVTDSAGAQPATARSWRPRTAHIVAATALVVIGVVIAAGSERPPAGPARTGGASNGTPPIRGPADLRLAWRAPTDRRPRELALGGRLTVGPDRTPVVGAKLDVLAGDQAGTARQLARVRTDRAGRFRLSLSIAGRPPSLLTVSFLARRGDTAPAALASARLHVRSAAPPSRVRRRSARATRRGRSTQQKEKKR